MMSAIPMTAGDSADYTPDPGYVDNADNDQQQDMPAVAKLQALMQMANIAVHLAEAGDKVDPDIQLDRISFKVIEDYHIDRDSCDEWRERLREAVNLAMLIAEQKDYPFEGASNVKYPMLTVAALQFNARAYAAIIQGNRIVKCPVWGPDPDGQKAQRGERVAEYMSYQLFEMPEWEEDTDRLLVMLPILGAVFRKIYYDPALGRNCTRLVTPDRLVVNYRARSIEDVPRLTEKLYLYPYEIQERIRDGRFLEFDYKGFSHANDDEEDDDPEGREDTDAAQLFLEQQRMIDLDGDGYAEPYVVTLHYASKKVCRIVANYSADTIHLDAQQQVTSIRRQDHFVKYQFLPSPDGGFYGWGFGWLLKDISESINTTLNQMLDAGHLSNVQGGFINSAMGIREKSMHLEMGEWRVVNFGGLTAPQAIIPIKYDGPSQVLFNLLGLLEQAGKEVASIKDVLTGDTQATAPVGTTLALIEQGLQVFTSIFKRVYRALKSELAIHARLNAENLTPDQYNELIGDGQQQFDPKADFDMSGKGMGIVPVADPSTATRMQKLAKAQAVLQIADTHQGLVDPREALERFFVAMDETDIDKLMPPPPPPDPEKAMLLRILAELGMEEKESNIEKNKTQAIFNLAQAGAQVQQGDLDSLRLMLDAYQQQIDARAGMDQQGDTSGSQQGGLPAMAGPAPNGMGAPAPAGPLPPGGGFGGPTTLPGGIPAGAGGMGAPPA